MLAITGRKAFGNVIQLEGHLRGKADEVFRKIREALKGEPVTPLLLEGDEHDVRVVVLPGAQTAGAVERPKWALHWLLFVFFIAGTPDAPAANDLTAVGPSRKALGYFTSSASLPVPECTFLNHVTRVIVHSGGGLDRSELSAQKANHEKPGCDCSGACLSQAGGAVHARPGRACPRAEPAGFKARSKSEIKGAAA